MYFILNVFYIKYILKKWFIWENVFWGLRTATGISAGSTRSVQWHPAGHNCPHWWRHRSTLVGDPFNTISHVRFSGVLPACCLHQGHEVWFVGSAKKAHFSSFCTGYLGNRHSDCRFCGSGTWRKAYSTCCSPTACRVSGRWVSTLVWRWQFKAVTCGITWAWWTSCCISA